MGDLDARIDSSVDPGLAEWMSKLESAFPFVTVNAPTEEVKSDDHRHLVGANILEADLGQIHRQAPPAVSGCPGFYSLRQLLP